MSTCYAYHNALTIKLKYGIPIPYMTTENEL